jgi:predicted HTH transcriptional regulator
MGSRAIGDRKKDYTSKAEFLLFVDREEIVSQAQVEAEFNMTFEGARSKIRRVWHEGLIEPLGVEEGKWSLIHLFSSISLPYR